ncbi:asparaginyl/glutamyl-tRNA amidotransferase subunit C [Candidatus Gottesmanbacteria bacterium RIFCSPLOWO2_01_FULL_39_12b]|uniref:Aspartyl/glutamyl-tRNA(Asn/Gln) amidotransferase subunit C n=1 Tax=Candidatus Gottesmanbacteria bacterium RIFCSPLOWO2_01_FULL_39_12b TaxID=1798388 RepID=A0A1F6AQM4_9BACT|nr:MAG: asparaginyl/glutamyl-tRNA amidotransferase subunit C [Candidatus Gottesmanbacteria bacterium RIFCSPLOWO2_01_FULL_39_12b]
MSSAKIISLDQVKHIANLARLPIKEEDLTKFQKELTAILDLFSKINEIDTKGIVPTSQVTGLENVIRSDEVKTSLSQKTVLSNAPKTNNGYFVVESVFD